MRRVLAAGLVTVAIAVSTAATADTPKCPDSSRVRSGTDFCASENIATNFPSLAFCESSDERYRKVCPVEDIESRWAGAKQGDIDPVQGDIDAALRGLKQSPSAEETESLRRNICIGGHTIVAFLEPRLRSWKATSVGKHALPTVAEASGVLASARSLEPYCKPLAVGGGPGR